MAGQQDGERTEPATPKRREEAREKGDVAKSRELASAGLLLAAFLALGSSLGVRAAEGVMGQTAALLGGAEIRPGSLGDYHAVLLHHLGETARSLAPFGLVLVVASVAVHVVQTGPFFSWKALAFRGNRISPLNGVKRLASLDQLYELAKSLLKVAIVAGIAWAVVSPALPKIVGLAAAGMGDGLAVLGILSRRVAIGVLLALGVLAALDVAWSRWRWEQKLKMTRHEVRDELKQREGDPRLKGRMRQLQQEVSRHRMIAAVPDSDVVVTNPTHYAVALRYRRGESTAPTVTARGRNHLARRIRDEARRHGVPVVENPPLARSLYRDTRVGREIPEALFQAVAEVLAYVYRLDPRHGGGAAA